MTVLSPTNKAYRRHTETVAVHASLGRGNHRRVVSQTQIVVSAKVNHMTAISNGNIRLLSSGDNALFFEQPFATGGCKLLFQLLIKRRGHSVISRIGLFSTYFTDL
jgi:hypothetical protein